MSDSSHPTGTTPELMHCPFCAGSPSAVDPVANAIRWIIECTDCGAGVVYDRRPDAAYRVESREDAIAAWNRRATLSTRISTALDADALDELAAKIEQITQVWLGFKSPERAELLRRAAAQLRAVLPPGASTTEASDFGLEQWVERQCGHLLGESALLELDAIVAKIRVAARSPDGCTEECEVDDAGYCKHAGPVPAARRPRDDGDDLVTRTHGKP